MDVNLTQLRDIVITASKAEILPRFNSTTYQYKADGSIVTDTDIAMQNRLTSDLQKIWPDITLLGEEMPIKQQQQLLSSEKLLWCLDPIDGSSNFATGLPCFSVSLALIDNGRVTLGVVYDPVREECFSAQLNQGATLNGRPLHARSFGLPLNRATALIDFKRLPASLAMQLVTDLPYGSQRNLGSIALELCWIASGRAHLYLHKKQQLWDYAAAVLILSEAGGHVCTLEGGKPIVNEVASCSTVASLDEQLFNEWCTYLNIPHV